MILTGIRSLRSQSFLGKAQGPTVRWAASSFDRASGIAVRRTSDLRLTRDRCACPSLACHVADDELRELPLDRLPVVVGCAADERECSLLCTDTVGSGYDQELKRSGGLSKRIVRPTLCS